MAQDMCRLHEKGPLADAAAQVFDEGLPKRAADRLTAEILIGTGRLTSTRADQQIVRRPVESNRHGGELRHRAYRTDQ
jgi:hypothetical protein